MSFLEYPVGLNQNGNKTVGEGGYYDLLRPYIRFIDRKTGVTNYIFDAFRSSNPLMINSIETENGIDETGSATIRILDDSNIDENLINWGNKVIIKIAKTQGEFTGNPDSTFLIGYVTGYKKDRIGGQVMEHELHVTGSKVLFNNRKILYKKSSETFNSNYQVKNHIKSIISDSSSYPAKSQTLLSQGNFSLSGINPDLKTFVGKVNYELIEAGGAIQRLADIEGARFFIDYKGDSEIVTVAFPSDQHTGVLIKSGDLKLSSDPADYSSYFAGQWDSSADITGSSGFANRLWTKTQISKKEFTGSHDNFSSTSLTFKALAQKFFITETRISELNLTLSMQGEVTSQNNRVNGEIRADNNNSPTGNLISSFNIPLGSIEKQPEVITVNDLNVKQRFVANAAPAWIVLYQRSGTEEVNKSDPNNDEQNTIRWHHNNNTSTTTDLISKKAASGDRKDVLTWNFMSSPTTGPTFCFGVSAEIRHIQEVSDRGSIDRYGLVDGEVDTSFLDEPQVIQTYLSALLQYASKPRIVFSTNSVKVPSNFLFKPYQIVTLYDTVGYPAGIECEIQKASYSFNESNSLGARTASITPVAYYDYKMDQFKCS